MKRLAERARVVRAIRAFFEARGFLEVETPILVPSPGLDLHLDAFATSAGARFLSTSPEYQMKRLLADGHHRIFQIAKCFRQGEVGARHNPEFTMLEWYRAGVGVTVGDVMADTEQLVAAVTAGEVVVDGRRVACAPPFARMTVCEAFEKYAAMTRAETLEAAARDEDRFFRALVDDVEPRLAELPHALFLTEYPASQASLARLDPRDREVAERFELYVAGVELCNGFGELTDAAEQRARLTRDQRERAARGLPVYPIDEKFLAALERGIPPAAGNALGVDRLVALACGSTAIRDAVAFTDDEL